MNWSSIRPVSSTDGFQVGTRVDPLPADLLSGTSRAVAARVGTPLTTLQNSFLHQVLREMSQAAFVVERVEPLRPDWAAGLNVAYPFVLASGKSPDGWSVQLVVDREVDLSPRHRWQGEGVVDAVSITCSKDGQAAFEARQYQAAGTVDVQLFFPDQNDPVAVPDDVSGQVHAAIRQVIENHPALLALKLSV